MLYTQLLILLLPLILLGTLISRFFQLLLQISYGLEVLSDGLTKFTLHLTLIAKSVSERIDIIFLFVNLALLIIKLAMKVITFSLLQIVLLLVEVGVS